MTMIGCCYLPQQAAPQVPHELQEPQAQAALSPLQAQLHTAFAVQQSPWGRLDDVAEMVPAAKSAAANPNAIVLNALRMMILLICEHVMKLSMPITIADSDGIPMHADADDGSLHELRIAEEVSAALRGMCGAAR